MTALPLVFDAPRRGKPPRHWSDLTPEQRRDAVTALGLPGYRARQLSTHWYDRLSDDPDGWTDLPAAVRDEVGAQLFPSLLTGVRTLSCDDDTTVKTLWRLHDGSLVESVLMRYRRHGSHEELGAEADDEGADAASVGRVHRTTVCVSSQAGCGMACPFCATGQGGLTRNLSTAEIVEQVGDAMRRLHRGELPGGPGRVNNVVFMGMGEPLANYRAVIGAVRTLTSAAPDGFGISARGITVSTVGLVPAINRLADEGLPVTLALSLHAPDDELRDELVPINTRWKVGEAVDAAYAYYERTGRRVSIEYALIRDINDQAFRADLLAEELQRPGRGWVHVNLIPLNPTPGSKWTASRRKDEAEFVRRLAAHGVPVTVRDTRGREIDGACGQLAASED